MANIDVKIRNYSQLEASRLVVNHQRSRYFEYLLADLHTERERGILLQFQMMKDGFYRRKG